MRGLAQRLDRAIGALSYAAAIAAALVLFLMFLMVQVEVVLRFFKRPTHWTHEISTYAVPWVVFLASAYVLRLGRHLEVDIVTSRLSEVTRNRLGILTDATAAAFCAYAAWHGKRFVDVANLMGATSASELDTPLWIPYLSLPVGFALLTLEFMARILVRLGYVERPASDSHAQQTIG